MELKRAVRTTFHAAMLKWHTTLKSESIKSSQVGNIALTPVN